MTQEFGPVELGDPDEVKWPSKDVEALLAQIRKLREDVEILKSGGFAWATNAEHFRKESASLRAQLAEAHEAMRLAEGLLGSYFDKYAGTAK